MERDATFYMANLGSEVSQVLRHYAREEYDRLDQSLDRAEKILNTLATLREMLPRTKELEILKDLLQQARNRSLQIKLEHIENYFLPFATRLLERAKQ